jgi:hypothetical protein
MLYLSLGFPSIYRLTPWNPRLRHLSISCHMQDEGFVIKNMSFDDLDLLLGVIEIQVVLHIFVHGLRFPMLYCDIFTYYMSVLIHYLLSLIIMWNLFLCSLDLVACIIIYLSCILLLVWAKFVEIYFMMS